MDLIIKQDGQNKPEEENSSPQMTGNPFKDHSEETSEKNSNSVFRSFAMTFQKHKQPQENLTQQDYTILYNQHKEKEKLDENLGQSDKMEPLFQDESPEKNPNKGGDQEEDSKEDIIEIQLNGLQGQLAELSPLHSLPITLPNSNQQSNLEVLDINLLKSPSSNSINPPAKSVRISTEFMSN